MRGLVGSQDGTYFHWSVPTSLYYLPTNLYTSVVDFINVRRLAESALFFHEPTEINKINNRCMQIRRRPLQTSRHRLMDIGASMSDVLSLVHTEKIVNDYSPKKGKEYKIWIKSFENPLKITIFKRF